jgi:hypothetical protein
MGQPEGLLCGPARHTDRSPPSRKRREHGKHTGRSPALPGQNGGVVRVGLAYEYAAGCGDSALQEIPNHGTEVNSRAVDQADSARGGILASQFSLAVVSDKLLVSQVFRRGSWQCRPGVVAAQQLRPQAAQDERVTLWAGFAE